jgi:hypothetical protein
MTATTTRPYITLTGLDNHPVFLRRDNLPLSVASDPMSDREYTVVRLGFVNHLFEINVIESPPAVLAAFGVDA